MYSFLLRALGRGAVLLTAGTLAPGFSAKAQPVRDTLVLSLPGMEKQFLDSNLQLLAAHYNTDAQKALIQQAKLWDNPVLNTDQVIAANGRMFPYGKNADGSYSGQYYLQVQQLIKTAGKRGKLINLATTNARLSELQLQDLLRNLRYQLHNDYYQAVQQLQTRRIYEGQLEQLTKLLNGMQAQLNAGNIAQKDFLRIQGLVIALQQDISNLDRDITETQSDLKTLLQQKDDSFIKPATGFAERDQEVLADMESIFSAARQNNPAFLLQQAQTVYQQQNLAYQRALRVPDVTVGPNFDRNSSFAPNYVGLGVSLPLPILNKNQGNIKSAQFGLKQQQTLEVNAATELRNNLANAWHKWMLMKQQDNAVQKGFYARYQEMYRNILQSYQQKQIGLLEFIDFFNDYTASQQRLLQQHLNLQLAKEELNYHAGIDIIK
jgi:cobalt-zinc-cadmium efflux system outer membrane protein